MIISNGSFCVSVYFSTAQDYIRNLLCQMENGEEIEVYKKLKLFNNNWLKREIIIKKDEIETKIIKKQLFYNDFFNKILFSFGFIYIGLIIYIILI